MASDSMFADMTVSRYTDATGATWYSLSVQGVPQMPAQRNAATVAAVVEHRLAVYRNRYGQTYQTLALPTVELWDGDAGERLPYDAATLAR